MLTSSANSWGGGPDGSRTLAISEGRGGFPFGFLQYCEIEKPSTASGARVMIQLIGINLARNIDK